LREAVELTHTYELAYYHHDYPSEAYWLWPLFDPRGLENGGNYLGYANDAELERWFREAMGHRHFPKVQEYTRLIHGAVESKMLLIPLWQLDTVVALHRNLKPTALDPLTVFTDIEHWRLDHR
jgi:ABC-type oligopeptide transport system substrate-binding subunit